MWDHKRTNGTRTYGGIGSGLFRSKDGGDTWERLENIVDPLPAYDQTQTGLKADASLGRIGIAIAPSDPNRIYVVTGSPYGPDKGFYYSDNGGDTLRVGGRAYASNGFQWWFGKIWVDPEDKNLIFNADVNLRRSTDGGMTWGNVGGVHADQHAMDWDRSTLDGNPATPRRVFLGNDGGTYRSENNGAPGSWVKSNNQPWNQIYHIAVSPHGLAAASSTACRTTAPTGRGRPPTRRRRIPSCATGTGPAAATATTTRSTRSTTASTTRARSPRAAARHSCTGRRDSATGHDDVHGHQQRLPGRSALHDRRADRDRPERPAARRRRHAAAERDLRRRQLHRALAEPRHVVRGDQPDRHDPDRPDRPDGRAARPDPGERDRHRALHEPLRRGDAPRPGEVGDPGAARAGHLRRHRHGPGVEDRGRGRDLEAHAGPADALGEQDHRRPGQPEPRLHRLLRLPPG